MVSCLKALCECFFFALSLPSSFLLCPCLFFFPTHTNTRAHHTSSAVLPLSLCFRWCRCCGRLIEMREEMTALCISASLQSPALPSTSASGTAAVGTQSSPPPLPPPSHSLCISPNSLPLSSTHKRFIFRCLFSQDPRLPLKIPPSSLISSLLSPVPPPFIFPLFCQQ